MTIPEKITSFLADVQDISIGHQEIRFVKPGDLEEAQTGYSVGPDGGSLVTGKAGDWQKAWLVIATDSADDPIMVDVRSHGLPVLSAAHGEGTWEPCVIADSLDNFKAIISMLDAVSGNRSSPAELAKNPVPDSEKQDFLADVADQNPESDHSYWENYFE